MKIKRSLRGLLLVAAVVSAGVAVSAAPGASAAVTCLTAVTFGATVPCAIEHTGEVDTFVLSASAGDGVLVHAVGAAGSGLDVDLALRDGSGATVCAARAGAAAEMLCKITATARYTVAVFDSGSDDVGNYRVDAQRVNHPVGAFALAAARPRHGVIGTAGDSDWYSFAAAANTSVVVRAAVIGAAPIEADLDVYGPGGDAVCASRAAMTAQVACAIPATGAYTLRVHDGADDETGRYAASVRPDCTITGTSGADTLTGTTGNDVICGLGGADKIAAGGGDDVIIGGTANDALDGGAGNDVFLADRAPDGADVVVGGTGADVLSYAERTGAVSVDADAVADDGEANERDDVRADVETLVGGAGNDTLIGSAASNTLYGGPGNDALNGMTGDDTFVADQDPDGADVIVGGAGRDHASWADRAAAMAADADGNADDGGAGESDNVAADVEALSGGAGADVLTGGTGADALAGGGGDDVLDGNTGNDVVDGGPGNDTFVVRPADGADVLSGGSGVDSVSYAVRSAALTVKVDGVADDGEVNEHDDVRADVENVTGGKGNDTIGGSAAANRLDGGPGNDTLTGAAGNDLLYGGPGYDVLDGGDGIDRCDTGPDGGTVRYCDAA